MTRLLTVMLALIPLACSSFNASASRSVHPATIGPESFEDPKIGDDDGIGSQFSMMIIFINIFLVLGPAAYDYDDDDANAPAESRLSLMPKIPRFPRCESLKIDLLFHAVEPTALTAVLNQRRIDEAYRAYILFPVFTGTVKVAHIDRCLLFVYFKSGSSEFISVHIDGSPYKEGFEKGVRWEFDYRGRRQCLPKTQIDSYEVQLNICAKDVPCSVESTDIASFQVFKHKTGSQEQRILKFIAQLRTTN